ncbi:MAG: ATP-binding protein [Myxococcales bacterium]
MAQDQLFRIDLLGRFRVSVGGEPAREPVSSRGSELLALLVLEDGQRVSRELIASRLWPESGEAQARTNLRRELHQLRRVLPQSEKGIEAPGQYLALRIGEVASDVHDLRGALGRAQAAHKEARRPDEIAALAEAARIYAGELFPECFSEWLGPPRERWKEEVAAALRRLIALLEGRRDLLEGIRWARRLTEIDALDEVAYRTLMRLHAAASDRPAALHVYHRCAHLLERELGVEPAPETRELYRSLIEGDAAPSGEVRPAGRSPSPETWALVGRVAERDQLLGAFRTASPAAARVACILGEPGIGKSRLADEVARLSEHEGARVARARAYAAEGHLSYGPVVDWLRSPTISPQLRDLDPVWRTEIARLLPEMLPAGEPTRGAEMQPPGGADSWLRRRLFEAVAHGLLGGSRPVVLVLDDLQWCDPETVSLLHYVSRYDAGAPLFVVATARTGELADNEAARGLLLALRQEGRLLEMELGPLGAADIAALLQAAAGEGGEALTAEAAQRVYQLSEGNPLFALEALRADLHVRSAAPGSDAAAPGNPLSRSPRVRAVLDARLAQLDPRARDLMQCAAAIGRAFSFDVLREAADLEEDQLVPALDELWRRRIVREHPTLGYDFSHDALREAATKGLSPARARLLHRRVAQAFELVHAANLDEISASLAVHCEMAGLLERATGYYRRAARVAAAVYAHPRAVSLLRRALEIVMRRDESRDRDREELPLLLEQTPSLRAIHGYTDPGLKAVLERARVLAERLEDSAALFQVLRSLWGLRFVSGDLSGTLEIAGQMRDLAALLGRYEAESHHALAGPLAHAGQLEKAIQHFEQARCLYHPEDARQHLIVFGSDLSVFNSAWEAHALWMSGLEDRAVASADEAVRTAQALGHAYSEALAQAYAAVLHYMRGDRRACAQAADGARAVCERHGFAYYRHWGTLLGAWARADGDLAAAVRTMRGALASLEEEGAAARRSIYLAAMAEVLAAAGRKEEALAVLDEAEDHAATSGDVLWSPELQRLRALLLPERAVEHAQLALQRAEAMRARPLVVRCAVTLGLALNRDRARSARAGEVVREALSALPDGGSSSDRDRAVQFLARLP